MELIPQELIRNWDQTSIHYAPISSWIIAKEGCKRISIAGTDDKQQIIVVLTATMTGKPLQLHLVYQGKTRSCSPLVSFPVVGMLHLPIVVTKYQWNSLFATLLFHMCKIQGKLQLDPGHRAL